MGNKGGYNCKKIEKKNVKSEVKFIYSEKAKYFAKLPLRFVLCSNGQIYGGDFAKLGGLLRICI